MSASSDPSAPSTPPPKRKRGAPPGNTNAVKHGYYSSRFGPHRPPEGLDSFALSDQIILLKVYIFNIKQLSAQLETVHDQGSLLRVLCLSMCSLTRLMNLQRMLPGSVENKENTRRVLCKLLAGLCAGAVANPPTASSSAPVDG